MLASPPGKFVATRLGRKLQHAASRVKVQRRQVTASRRVRRQQQAANGSSPFHDQDKAVIGPLRWLAPFETRCGQLPLRVLRIERDGISLGEIGCGVGQRTWPRALLPGGRAEVIRYPQFENRGGFGRMGQTATQHGGSKQ